MMNDASLEEKNRLEYGKDHGSCSQVVTGSERWIHNWNVLFASLNEWGGREKENNCILSVRRDTGRQHQIGNRKRLVVALMLLKLLLAAQPVQLNLTARPVLLSVQAEATKRSLLCLSINLSLLISPHFLATKASIKQWPSCESQTAELPRCWHLKLY